MNNSKANRGKYTENVNTTIKMKSEVYIKFCSDMVHS